MEIEFKKDANVLFVKPVGRIDSNNASDLENAIQIKKDSDITEIRIDMSEIQYVSSKGIRVLLILHRQMEESGRLVLTNLNNSVQEVLRLSALLKTFHIE